MSSPIDLKSPGPGRSDKLLPERQNRVRLRRVATSGSGGETFFPHDSNSDDDDGDLSDVTEHMQEHWEAIKDTSEQINRSNRMKKRLIKEYDAQQTKMGEQLEQKDREIETLRKKVASKDATIEQKVSELDKQMEEKSKQAVAIRSLELKLTYITEENRKLKEKLKVMEERCQSLPRKHRDKDAKLPEHDLELSVSQETCSQNRRELQDKDAKLPEHDLELSVSQETCSQNRRELQKLKDELSVERASNAQLTQTIQDLQCRNGALERKLESKTSTLDGFLSTFVELTNKVKDVKEQQANYDEESDGTVADSGINCISKDDIDSLPPVTMNALADYVEEITPKWELVGHSLPVGTAVIQYLRDQPCNPQSKCTQVLEKWLEESAEVSWTKFFDVLRRQKLTSLVSRIIGQLKATPQ